MVRAELHVPGEVGPMLLRLCQVIVIVIFGLGVGTTRASTFNVDGTFSNGAFLTGSIDLNGGLLLSVDLNANGSLPGDNATHWSGPVFLRRYVYCFKPFLLLRSAIVQRNGNISGGFENVRLYLQRRRVISLSGFEIRFGAVRNDLRWFGF